MSSILDDMLDGYVAAALWSSSDEDGEPLDATYSRDDIAPETLEQMREDCSAFLEGEDTGAMLAAYAATSRGANPAELAGHDFWLTRNGHGAGFWDRGFGDLGDRLSDVARPYGGIDLYVGDDSLIYG